MIALSSSKIKNIYPILPKIQMLKLFVVQIRTRMKGYCIHYKILNIVSNPPVQHLAPVIEAVSDASADAHEDFNDDENFDSGNLLRSKLLETSEVAQNLAEFNGKSCRYQSTLLHCFSYP